MPYIIFALSGYLLGSILFSYALPKIILGIDITKLSRDKNPGTANAMKYAGVPIGSLCLLLDIAKGFAPVYVAKFYCDEDKLWFALVIAAPVVGHAFSLFRRFHGGKAIATTFGIFGGMYPSLWAFWTLAAIYIFFSTAFIIRPNEKRSVVTFVLLFLFALAYWIFGKISTAILLGVFIISLTVAYKNSRVAERRVEELNAKTV